MLMGREGLSSMSVLHGCPQPVSHFPFLSFHLTALLPLLTHSSTRPFSFFFVFFFFPHVHPSSSRPPASASPRMEQPLLSRETGWGGRRSWPSRGQGWALPAWDTAVKNRAVSPSLSVCLSVAAHLVRGGTGPCYAVLSLAQHGCRILAPATLE